MNFTELATLSIKELRSICTSQNIEVVGDKRSRQTWIEAIVNYNLIQTRNVVSSPEKDCLQPNPYEVVIELPIKAEGEHLPEPRQMIGAHLVLIALFAILYAVLSIAIGIGVVMYRISLWLVERTKARHQGGRVPSHLTKSFGNSRSEANPIDYFPSLA
jgi:hypothetical protein